MKTRNHNLLFFAFLLPISLAIVISLPSKFTTWSGGRGWATNFIIFLRVYRGKQRRPYEKAEDWVWWVLYGGYYWHVR